MIPIWSATRIETPEKVKTSTIWYISIPCLIADHYI